MNPAEKLKLLKELIDENSYPIFDDDYLLPIISNGVNILEIAVDLCYRKAAIPDIRLGDVTIQSPRNHFMAMARRYENMELDEKGNLKPRKSKARIVVRADGQ